jgi:SET domain
MSARDMIVVKPVGDGQGVFAAHPLAAGETLGTFTGTETPVRSRMSLQFGPGLHVEPGDDEPLRYLNHACAPTAVFKGRTLYAARNLAVGTEITIDYTAHEDEVAHPFICRCGAPGCRGLIQGRDRPTR